MSFKKKLFTTVGPLFLAVAILAGIFYTPVRAPKITDKQVAKASSSMAVNVIKGNLLKNTAMASREYVPFFGSSELSRINPFHPTVLAEKYDRNYRPFLLGAAGTQSLAQFLMLQSMGKELKGQKAVFIVSPQWFVSGGVSQEMFSLYYSSLQAYQWVVSAPANDESTIYTANRLLKFSSVDSDTTMKSLLQQMAAGKSLSEAQIKTCQTKLKLLSREDDLFGELGLMPKTLKIKQALKSLPAVYDNQELDHLALEIGQASTSNNEFQIKRQFYQKRIKPVKKSLADSQKNYDYRQSVEFSDFQLFLSEVARLEMDVLFVIPPVNGRWSEYTGLSTAMLDQFSQKITQQLKSQGFNHVLDFTQDRHEDYFMEDTIHIGWRGWVALDKEVAPFLAPRPSSKKAYQIDDYYFTKEWQQTIVESAP